jgi:UDP-3-O-[3-hydroxymyristoyl] glucosamine N-acyltransferase
VWHRIFPDGLKFHVGRTQISTWSPSRQIHIGYGIYLGGHLGSEVVEGGEDEMVVGDEVAVEEKVVVGGEVAVEDKVVVGGEVC